MNSSITKPSNKDVIKHQQYTKQQQQLRDLGFFKNNSQSKVLSADKMIEDMLSKKETFQKRNPELPKNQDAAIPPWLCTTPPPLYERVWQSVQTAGGLADTPLLSSVLLTSGLPTDTLGYIWSLANHTVPGALTQSEVYLILALVGLAQAGYVVNNLSALHQVPQAPIPTLDLSRLPVRQQHMYPNTLNVTNLPDPSSFNWNPPETANTSYSGQIGVSYVSNEPMVSPNLILNETNKSSLNMKFPNGTPNVETSVHNNIVSKNSKPDLIVGTKSNSDIKRYENSHSFSFPKLNDSPSHILNQNQDNIDPFDDEFTEFQSADFSTISGSQGVESNLNSAIDEDEFTHFQNASTNYNGDDLSVLVIGGKHIPSAQQLWVAVNPSKGSTTDDKPDSEHMSHTEEGKCRSETKYDVFQELADDKYSVFHNPLPDDDDKQNTGRDVLVENMQMETKSIFQHSLFDEPEPTIDVFSSTIQTSSLNLPNIYLNTETKETVQTEDDDEFSNFQNFPVTFPENITAVSSENTDKYDVFRTIVFENTSSQENNFLTKAVNNVENLSQIQQPFESGMEDYQKGYQYNNFSDSPETKSVDSIHFGDIQEQATLPSSDSSNMDSLFSSLVISERKNETENSSEMSSELIPAGDKYNALRLLEPATEEVDDFGEFLGAELPNSENGPTKSKEAASIQIRCLEACLQLLKDAESKMSQCSTPEVVSEVLSDTRASTYFDCQLDQISILSLRTSQR